MVDYRGPGGSTSWRTRLREHNEWKMIAIRAIPRSCFRQKADRWVGDGLGPGGSTSWRTRLRECNEWKMIAIRAIPRSCFRQKADRWVGKGLGPGGSTSWRTRLRSCFRQTCVIRGSENTGAPPVMVRALADPSDHPVKSRSNARLRRDARLSLRRGRPKQRARAPVLPTRGDSTIIVFAAGWCRDTSSEATAKQAPPSKHRQASTAKQAPPRIGRHASAARHPIPQNACCLRLPSPP